MRNSFSARLISFPSVIDDVAGDLRVLVERLLLDEQFEGGVTARAGQHFVFALVGLTDLEIL